MCPLAPTRGALASGQHTTERTAQNGFFVRDLIAARALGKLDSLSGSEHKGSIVTPMSGTALCHAKFVLVARWHHFAIGNTLKQQCVMSGCNALKFLRAAAHTTPRTTVHSLGEKNLTNTRKGQN